MERSVLNRLSPLEGSSHANSRTAHQAPSNKQIEKQQATSKSKSNLKFRTILLETLEQRSLFAADILNTSLHLGDSGPIIEPAQIDEPKQSLLRVKEAFTAGNAVRFPDSNYFSTLIAGVQDGAKVSGDEAVDAAWSDFHQRTVNVPTASKASFGIIQSVADNPSPFQSKLLHNDLSARSIDRSPLDSSTAFGPVTPTTQLVMQQFNAPLLHGSQRTASIESARSFAILPDTAIGWFCTADGLVIDSNGQPIVGSHSTLTAEGEGDESLVPEVTLPQIEAWNHSGSISTYQPSTNTNGQSISTQGSFTASTTSESDMTIPGVHSVHTINRVWIDSQRWSVTESLIFAFNVTVSVPLPEPDEDSSGSNGSNGGDTEGSSSDLSHTHDIETTTSASATITRKGFVILVFHAERGITTPSAAGVKWSFNVNYSDAITIGIEAGAESTEKAQTKDRHFLLTSVCFWGMIWLVGTIDASAVREMNL